MTRNDFVFCEPGTAAVQNLGNWAPGRETQMQRFCQVFPWIAALDAYDYGDSAPLSDLIAHDTIPDEFKQAVADIVEGRRRPNRRAASKLKVPAAERMKIAAHISAFLGVIDLLKRGTYDGERLIEHYAEQHGAEPIEAKRLLEQSAASEIEETARDLEVSVETIENLLRDLREKIAKFPVV